MDDSDRHRMIADWQEGLLPEAGAAKLLEELRNDPGLRRRMAKAVVVGRFLESKRIPAGDFSRQVLETLQGEEADSLTSNVIAGLQRRQNRQRRFAWAGIGLAAAAMIVFGLILVLNPGNRDSGIRIVAAEGVGTLDTDAILNGREITLRAGILELDLNREARIVVEAPARFQVLSPLHLVLREGRCFAEMDEGRSGLRIETPSGEVLDLGTKFAVDVSSPEEMKVHVFEGEVEVSDRKRKRRLKKGRGLVVKRSGEQQDLVAAPELFVSRVPQDGGAPAPYLHWSFDEGSGTTAHASGPKGRRPGGAGTLVAKHPSKPGPTWVEGVFGSALEFGGKGQWVETGHPGVSGSRDRTVACWVKLPPDWGSGDRGPMISWGSPDKKKTGQGWKFAVGRGSNAWPERTGRLYLSLGNRSVIGTTDLRDGRWHHVAAVALGGEGVPTFLLYVDGQLENVARNTVELMQTETGEESASTVRFGHQLFHDNQFLHGWLDEIYLFEAALSGDQIRALMRGEDPRSAH